MATKPRFSHLAAVAALTVLSTACSGGVGSLPGTRTPGSTLVHGMNIARALPGTSPTPIPANAQPCSGPPGTANCGVQQNKAVPPGSSPAAGLGAGALRALYGLPALAAYTAPTGPQPTPPPNVPQTPAPAATPVPPGATPAPPPTPTPPKSQIWGTGPVVAVVDAFDDPQAEHDMGVYRAQYGLQPCTSGSHCFQKINVPPAPGASPPPPPPPPNSVQGTTWNDEIALDLAMVSASCPNCGIVLVEAAGQDLDSLVAAENWAAYYQPAAISNSWGVPEGGGNAAQLTAPELAAFDRPGIAITAATGDLGNGAVQFPASSPYVTAIGGTSLTPDAGSPRGYDESAWAGTGAGCSLLSATPSWQSVTQGCASRAVPDVSFIADFVNPGIAVYSSVQGGWIVLGGSSAGAPFIAGLYAQAGDYGSATTGAPALYAHASALNQIPNAPTLGTPNGLAGF